MSSHSPPSFGERRRRVGAAQRPAVNPIWPTLALMFAGVWLAWPWFLVNEYLIRTDELRHQTKLVVIGLVGAFALAWLVMALVNIEVLGVREARYAFILLLAWKLGITYLLQSRQARGFELWRYFGGEPKNGAYLAIAGYFLTEPLFEQLPLGLLWLVLR